MKTEEKRYLSADEFLHDSWRLAASVRRGGWRPDVLLALWRGGAFPGVAVHEFLKASGWPLRHLPLKCSSYTGIGSTSGQVLFEFADAALCSIGRGERVLVVDDVLDTGITAKAVRRRLAEAGADARVATVYWKRANDRTGETPDYYVRELDEWIVFPHEIEGLDRSEVARKDPLLAALLPTAEN